MSVSVESTSSLGRKLEAKIPNKKLEDLLKVKINKLSREVKLKGFRPGKVPINVIQKQFGPSVRQEAIAELIEETLRDAFNEQNIQPAGQPIVEEISDKDKENVTFTATFEIFPQIELVDVAELEVDKKVVEISDKDIQEMTDKLCRNLGEWNNTEDAAADGDRMVIDFVRTIDGDDEEESKNGVRIELGAPTTLPGLSEKLVGCKVADNKTITITYPEDWSEEKAAGKKAKLNVTIKEVITNKPLTPETLAERLGLKGKGDDALPNKIRERMQDEANRAVFNELQENVLEVLLEKNTFDIPDVLLQQEKQAITKEQHQRAQAGQAAAKMSEAEVDEMALKRVKLGLLINEVIKKYNLKPDGKRLRKEVEYMAQEFPNPEEIVNVYFSNKQLLSSVERVVLLQQSVEVLVNDMKVKEESVTFDSVMNPNKK